MPSVASVPGLRWLGHSCVLLEGPPAVYLDPWRLEDRERLPPAALVLVTHAHFDHCSPESVARVAGEGTLVAGPPDALALLPGFRRLPVAPGDAFTEAGVRVRVLASGDPGPGFHPAGGGLAFLVEGAGPRFLHAGDGAAPLPRLDPPPEVIGVPVGGGTVPGPEEGAAAAAASGAPLALPLHWGDLQGGHADAIRFRDALLRAAPSMRTILRDIPPARR
ncbi:MAG: MBL fold metallo-hydrolase [Planctomycetes bacterium]|nr:MBL fold metallo-hydrolase [Planctomycetota bacterium]